MLPAAVLPISLRRLLDAFTGCFTKPTLQVFHAMVIGSVAQTGRRTVCGILTGVGLATSWSHDRAHRFFSTARWSVDQIGLTVFDLVVSHRVADDADLLLAVDDTAHRRRGKTVHGAGWIHDGSVPSRNKLAFGHRWVVVGVIVRVSFMSRPLCLPVLCRRRQGKGTTSTVDLAAQMITILAARVPHRHLHVVADAAYHGKACGTYPPPSPGRPGCPVTRCCITGRRPLPVSGAGHGARATGSVPPPRPRPPRCGAP
jgi:hypothetical protein